MSEISPRAAIGTNAAGMVSKPATVARQFCASPSNDKKCKCKKDKDGGAFLAVPFFAFTTH
jgi:hypothetical protein